MANVIRPDYARLKNQLNRSNLQNDSPQLYQILDQLIKLAVQDQQANVVAADTTFTGVSVVDPISGDGVSSPLGVKIDGTSVTLNGSGQLQSTDVTSLARVAFFTLSQTELQNIFATPKQIVAAQTGKTLVVIGFYTRSTKNAQPWNNGGANFQVRWNGNTANLSNGNPTGLNTITAGDCEVNTTSANQTNNSNSAFHPKGVSLVITNDTGALTPVNPVLAVASAVGCVAYYITN